MSNAKSRWAGRTEPCGGDLRAEGAKASRPAAALVLLGSALLCCVLSLAMAQRAGAEVTHVYDSSFAPTGLLTPASVAIDEASGNVYVRDGNQILKFDEDGNPVDFSALAGNAITATCGGECSELAVDNSGGANQGVIYLSTMISGGPSSDRGVLVFLPSGEPADPIRNWSTGEQAHPFCGVATDPAGSVYVVHDQGFERASTRPYPPSGNYIDRLVPGTWVGQAEEEHEVWPIVATMFGLTPDLNSGGCRLEVNSEGDVYYSFYPFYESSTASYTIKRAPHDGFDFLPGPPEATIESARNFAVDQTNDRLFTDRGTEIARFGPENQLEETFGSGQLQDSLAVAVNGATGTVYATDDQTDSVAVFKALVTPDVASGTPDVGPTSATLHGEVGTAGAGDVVDCEFQWGSDANYGNSLQCDPDAAGTPFTGPQAVSAALAGLEKEHTYHYRLVATNADGTTRGVDQTFTTHNVADLETDPATGITQTGATLNGSFTGDGDSISYYFQWGSDQGYGNETPLQSAGSPNGPATVSASITGLAIYGPETGSYHFRVVATNSAGTTYGPDRTFHTAPPSPPTISGTAAGAIQSTEATVNAAVDPEGSSTVYLVEYGLDASYGSGTLTSEPIGEDSVDHAVTATITGLTQGRTYHFRVVATNFGGTTVGPDGTFATLGPPRIDGSSVGSIGLTTARLSAFLVANGSATALRFEYGESAGYGSTSASVPVGAGSTGTGAAVDVSGLTAGRTYHFRAVAANALGTAFGPDQTFTTLGGAVATTPALATPKPRCRHGSVKRKGKCVKKHKKKRHGKHSRSQGRRDG